MFSSIFSTAAPVDPHSPNFHPVTSSFKPEELFGILDPQDTEWTCAGGFVTETQVWYHVLSDGTFVMFQVIHSAVGVWYPTIQFTCKVYNPNTKEQTWKSINVTNFVTPPPLAGGKTFSKRSSKADQFSIYHADTDVGSEFAETYTISANLDKDLQISVVVSRPNAVPGFKLGQGPKGGFSYFGHDIEKPEGYVVHRFWPRTQCTGHIILKGQAITADGVGMFVHAIQGMRPNLVASRWNFANFQSSQHGGVSAVQMELTTTSDYGRAGHGSGGVKVNVGSIVVGGKLIAVTGETTFEKETPPEDAAVISRAVHLDKELDPDTSYEAPSRIKYTWKGPVLVHVKSDEPKSDVLKGDVSAELETDVGGPKAPKGLLEKVDVLAEIPYAIKLAVNYLASTKPYIYQWLNPAKLTVHAPTSVIPEGDIEVEGTVYNEATFIS